jgi:hypothetical protein
MMNSKQTMTTSHTPTPWTTGISSNKKNGDAWRDILADWNGKPLYLGEAQKNDAAFIVRCVNAHDDLVAALKDLDDCYCEAGEQLTHIQRANHRKVLMQARAALDKATQ